MNEKTSFQVNARNEYHGIDPYLCLPVSRPPGLFDKAISLFSELKSDILKRKFRRIEHRGGVGIHLDDPDAIDTIPNSIAAKVTYLYVFSRKGKAILDLACLDRFPKLRDLSLGAHTTPIHLSRLGNRNGLERIAIQTKVNEELPFQEMSSLKELSINGGSNISNIGDLAESLEALSIDHLPQFKEPLQALSKIKRLKITVLREEENLKFLKGFRKLKILELYGLNSLVRLDGIDQVRSVTHLVLEHCRNLENISTLATLEELKFLELRKCPLIQGIDSLQELKKLTEFYVFDCPSISHDEALSIASKKAVRCYFFYDASNHGNMNRRGKENRHKTRKRARSARI